MNERPNIILFNGVNGETGEYGVPPTTVDALYERIVATYRAKPKYEQAIQSARRYTEALKTLVHFLAETAWEGVDEDGKSAWLEALAGLLAKHLLEPAHRTDARIAAIQKRLGHGTVERLDEIVAAMLDEDQGKLADLLLKDQDEEPEFVTALAERLKQDTKARITALQKGPVAPAQAVALAQGAGAREAWQDGLIADLRAIEGDAIAAIGVIRNNDLRSLVTRTQRDLARRLGDWAGRDAEAAPWIAPLREELDALERQRRRLEWGALVDAIERGLESLGPQDATTRWAGLLEVLYWWINALGEEVGRELGVMKGIDATDLADAGWGIIFPFPDSPQARERYAQIKAALEPLLRLRKAQAGERYKEYVDNDGYRFNDTARSFLNRYCGSPSEPVDPRKVPYYLLIVGGPDEIPFHFQYQVDVQYAVGRVDFDEVEDYASYARSVVAAELGLVTLPRAAAFFGVAHEGDDATAQSASKLVEPLAEHARALAEGGPWSVETVLREAATKPALRRLLGGEATPALLFTASHGMEFPKGHARQRRHQGAILCREGQPGQGEVLPNVYFSADDVDGDANLAGLIAFVFACYGAGTPRYDAYYKFDFQESGATLTDEAFVAALPKAMLRLARGGALAVVGHVERALGFAFTRADQVPQITHYTSAVEALLNGEPVGLALEYFNERYAALSTELTAAIESLDGFGPKTDRCAVAEMWAGNNDARGYIILGDPAVRLPLAPQGDDPTGRGEVRAAAVEAALAARGW